MRITNVLAQPNWKLAVVADDGRTGVFDVTPYLCDDAFEDLKNPAEFNAVWNGGYFVEWKNGADLSADTIEAHWILNEK